MEGILAHVTMDLTSLSGALFQTLHGLIVQPLGMHAWAGELVAQAFGDALRLVGLGIWRGQPGQQKQGADEHQQVPQ